MSQDPFSKDHHLRTKLDEYHVEIPNFPMKPSRWERLINLLASPAKDPIDPIISTAKWTFITKNCSNNGNSRIHINTSFHFSITVRARGASSVSSL